MLTVDFDGTTPPEGWTWDDPTAGAATYEVANGRMRVHFPTGVAADSISNTTNPDGSVGLVHAYPGGDLDVAAQVSTDISNNASLGWLIFVTGEGSAASRYSLYAPFGPSDPGMRIYGYHRNAGGGSSSGNNSLTADQYYQWLRVKYVAAAGTWTCYGSMDGHNWVQLQQATRPFNPTRVKIGAIHALNGLVAGTVEITRFVDLLAAGTDDARSPLSEYTRQHLTGFFGTDGALPADLSTTLAVGATTEWTGSALRMSVIPDNGSSVKIGYTGPPVADCGVLAFISHPGGHTQAYMTVGVDHPDGDPTDQYSSGPGYSWETHGGVSRRVMRVDRKVATTHFESPYTRMVQTSDTNLAFGSEWVRLEKVAQRIRVKTWPEGSDEPAEWNWIDGDDEMHHDLLWSGAISYSHNDNVAMSVPATSEIYGFEFYELVPDETPTGPTFWVLLTDGTEMPATLEGVLLPDGTVVATDVSVAEPA